MTIDQIITEHREIYEGKVALDVFRPGLHIWVYSNQVPNRMYFSGIRRYINFDNKENYQYFHYNYL